MASKNINVYELDKANRIVEHKSEGCQVGSQENPFF